MLARDHVCLSRVQAACARADSEGGERLATTRPDGGTCSARGWRMRGEREHRGEPERAQQRAYADASMPGISPAAVVDFCDAVEFALYKAEATEADERTLRDALLAIAREAHQKGITAERVLIGLKAVWSKVCGHFPEPDVNDRRWGLVVRLALEGYERTRARNAG